MEAKDRLKQLILRYGPTQKDFANRINASQPTIANWIATNKIPNGGVMKIITHIPEVDIDWLTGETEKREMQAMPKRSNQLAGEGTPFYPNVSASCGLKEMATDDMTTERIVIPGYNLDFYIPASGRSMLPTIQPGDVVGLREWTDVHNLRPGHIYLFETTNDEYMLKRVRKVDPNSEYITLYSDNEDEFPPFDILKETIHGIFRVVNLIRRLD